MPAKMFNQFLCSSLMLPEHREALNRHNAEMRQQKTPRPCIEEQQRELWDRLLIDSLQQGKELSICCMDRRGARRFNGVVCALDPLHQRISIRGTGSVIRIPLDSIISVDCGE